MIVGVTDGLTTGALGWRGVTVSRGGAGFGVTDRGEVRGARGVVLMKLDDGDVWGFSTCVRGVLGLATSALAGATARKSNAATTARMRATIPN